MTKKHESKKKKLRSFSYDTRYTQSRELSWLQFNDRVLQEAEDEAVPLFERLKFVSIFTSNLDEFFMIRVGSLTDIAAVSKEDLPDNKCGWTAAGSSAKQCSRPAAASGCRSLRPGPQDWGLQGWSLPRASPEAWVVA